MSSFDAFLWIFWHGDQDISISVLWWLLKVSVLRRQKCLTVSGAGAPRDLCKIFYWKLPFPHILHLQDTFMPLKCQMSLWVWVFCDPPALIVCLNKIALVCYRTSCISLLNYRRLYEFVSKCTSIKVHHGLKERAKVVKSLETKLINLESWLNCLCTWERLGVSEISWVFNYASQAPQSTKPLSNLLRNMLSPNYITDIEG